ncbi:Shedu immune nuclease family protein [Rhodococcus rhodochrous]|uniref:Shedu immune nuclease family protein n=1 Tax=Rhodococcus rhodochrous TaxID=1829 RepID=UPI00188D5872|nr:Shedu immune nuclease family protein [Rhodococcus rhodochrous]MBF4478289.1 DUF4263 domain-containing protein [Rhodococcus rhodochrous]
MKMVFSSHANPSSQPKEALLYRLSENASELKIFPLYPFSDATRRFLEPKYRKIHTLTIELESEATTYSPEVDDIVAELPKGFVKDYTYGLGLVKDCGRLIDLIEDHTECNEIYFSAGTDVLPEGNRLRFGLDLFNALFSEISRINNRGHRAAARVKDAFVHNQLAPFFQLNPVKYSLGRHPVSKVLTKAAADVTELTKQEQDSLVNVLASASASLARTRPEVFVKLHQDVEIANLDRLISSFEDAMSKKKEEGFWQKFFNNNAFALQQIFGTPMVNFQSTANVGGAGFHGGGGKITDYLFRNSLTNNVALVELKKPSTRLLNATEYRDGVFTPSKELTGAVSQVMDQAYKLTMSFPVMKLSSRNLGDLEAYAVSCFVVIGSTPPTDDEKKSFEMYRSNSRHVKIVTYDEILEQLKLLRQLLYPTSKASEKVADPTSEGME